MDPDRLCHHASAKPKRMGLNAPPSHSAPTRRSHPVNALAGSSDTTQDLYQRMRDLYPDRVNPGMLWFSARRTKG
jgi:hypothetical protein